MTAPLPLMRGARRTPGAGKYQDQANLATNAAAADAGEALSRDVGARLGGLAGIGALRSGGAAAGIQEASRTYSQQVSRAAAANALQAAGLDQRDAESMRDLGFREKSLASGETQAGLERASREKLAGDELGFKREDLAARNDQFGRDLGFREKSLASGETQAGLERASREGIEGRRLASGELLAGLDRAERARTFDADLGFRTGESAKQDRQFGEDLGFRRTQEANRGEQFYSDLGFRREDATARRSLDERRFAEEQRQFNQQRADALKAAEQKRKGGLMGFVGKALGVASSFIPGGNLVKTAVNVAGNAVSKRATPTNAWEGYG